MTEHHPAVRTGYDPNRLLNGLLLRMSLKDDEALCRTLDVGIPLIMKIRNGESPIGPSLLIRMAEMSAISVRELREMMGDRRSQYRLHDTAARRKLSDADEAGLPNSVQWG
jgi:hypothetical protein